MNKIGEIKELAFGKELVAIALAEVTFSDGRIGRFEGETLEVGAMLTIVTDAGEVPAEGELELESNGSIVTAEAGIVKSIVEVAATEEVVEEKPLSLSKEEIAIIISEHLKEELDLFKKEYEVKFEAQAKEIETLKGINVKQTELNDLFSKTPIAKPTETPKKSTAKGSYLEKYNRINN